MSLPQAPRIYLVAAVASNGIIGANGALPWRLPEDLQHFKRVTMGHPVIMGRKTWESLKGPLPGRDNIVVTRTAGYETPGAAVASSLEAALALCLGEPVAFVVGGSSLFAESLPSAAGLVMTEIHKDFEGDTWFPPYDRSRWKESQREQHVTADGMKFDFVLYEPT
ncbi:MAG TPA: dihydrofolate reductase [Burkholderiales bacterium]|jgi:dihydrofolate reductase|nr:dihydrofolate reductase [Burkholderiales bacterium]